MVEWGVKVDVGQIGDCVFRDELIWQKRYIYQQCCYHSADSAALASCLGANAAVVLRQIQHLFPAVSL